MNMIQKFIKWILSEIKSVYEDFREWNITEQEYELMFWMMCAFWTFIIIVFSFGVINV